MSYFSTKIQRVTDKTLWVSLRRMEGRKVEGVSDPLYRVVMKICEKRGYTPKITYTPSVMDTVFTQVSAGMGVSIVPSLNEYYSDPNLKYIEIPGEDLETDVTAIWDSANDNPGLLLYLDTLH